MIVALTWIATTIAIVGSILNSYKRIEGFYCWIVSNLISVWINMHFGIVAQAVLFGFNTLICLWGLMQWKKKKNV